MKAVHDPTYIMLAEAAKKQVAANGKFLKHDAIVDAGFGSFEDKISGFIQWPVVRAAVESESGSMIGIAADGAEWDPEIHPEKFLPGGKRRTIGYALASTFPRVAQEALRRQVAQIGGLCRSVDAKALSFKAQGVAIAYNPGSAPILALPTVAAE